MNKLKQILLVEDDARDLELTKAALLENNVVNEIVVARDGAEALDYLYRRGPYSERTTGNPVVVLLDLNMPKVDGLEVLKQLKADPDLKTLPVVMLTTSKEESDLIKSYTLGVNAYVVKPLDFEQFVEAVKHIRMFWAIFNEPPPQSWICNAP